MDTRKTGALIMVGAIANFLLFAVGLSRRSYLAIAAPVALAVTGLSALGVWVGWTMLTIEPDMPEPELAEELDE
jgi:branched-subunit amino acid ABC-type transport system permease component